MDEKKVNRIIRRIDRALLELAAETGEEHISAFIVNKSICVNSFRGEENGIINYFRNGVNKK